MRITFALPLIIACGLAGAATAQPPAPSADNHAQTVSTAVAPQKPEAAQAPSRAQSEDAQAAAALVIAVRHAEDLERMARLACAAGDTSKCRGPSSADTARSPSS
jgi:hypothetical protein